MTNLQQLQKVTDNLNTEERNAFDDFLIGALSAIVEKDDWQAAMKSALECLARRNARMAVRP